MAEWSETYRGSVSAWKSDIVEDFTVAYHFERLAKSRQHGHQLADRVGARTVTWLAQALALRASEKPRLWRRLEARTVVLPRPALPQPIQGTAQGTLTARDRITPSEIDEGGTMPLSACIHWYSRASMQFLSSIGMPGAHMHQNRRRSFSGLGAGDQTRRGREGGDRNRRQDLHRPSRQYLASLFPIAERCGLVQDRVSSAGRCAAKPGREAVIRPLAHAQTC